MKTSEYISMHSEEEGHWWYRALHDITLERLKAARTNERTKLLDAGCGTGGLLKKLSIASPNTDAIGLEFNQTAIGLLKQHDELSIINGNVNKMPFAEKQFDIITLNDVLYHNNIKPEQCLSECFRVLKPEGYLFINVAAYNWLHSAHDIQVHTRERYTAKKLKAQLLDSGFIVERAAYWNSLLFPIMVLHRLTSGKLKKTSDVKDIPNWQNRLFYRIICFEQLLQKHRIYIPYGGSVWARAKKP